MGDKKILVFVNGSVSEKGANVSSGQKVCWEPDESDRKVIITFLKDVPFGDWGSSNEQAGHQVF